MVLMLAGTDPEFGFGNRGHNGSGRVLSDQTPWHDRRITAERAATVRAFPPPNQ